MLQPTALATEQLFPNMARISSDQLEVYSERQQSAVSRQRQLVSKSSDHQLPANLSKLPPANATSEQHKAAANSTGTCAISGAVPVKLLSAADEVRKTASKEQCSPVGQADPELVQLQEKWSALLGQGHQIIVSIDYKIYILMIYIL
jgi:hypothetical protein